MSLVKQWLLLSITPVVVWNIYWVVLHLQAIPDPLGIMEMLVLEDRGTLEYPEKNLLGQEQEPKTN